jgi:pyridoxal phosphate enzyme (YggS family)
VDAAEVADRVAGIRSRIEAAALRAGREESAVTLVAASKLQPIERLEAAFAAGVRVFGESRVQEAVAKIPALPPAIDWHFIGPLQTNKARVAAATFSTFHSIDRLRVAEALDAEAQRVGRVLRCFLEVNIGAEETKHGFAPAEIAAALPRLLELRALEIVGLMAVPPAGPTPEHSRRWFRALAELRDRIARAPGYDSFPGLLSMGMSDDFEVAIEEGATHVRIGSALFGPRAVIPR